MAQPQQIELQTGPDRRYRQVVLALWLLSAASLLVHVQRLSWPLLIAGSILLVILRPGAKGPIKASCRLRLQQNGTAAFGDDAGRWGMQSWSCRWYTVLRIDLPHRPIHALVSASRNNPGDYRRLLVWTRFSPFGEVSQERGSHQS